MLLMIPSTASLLRPTYWDRLLFTRSHAAPRRRITVSVQTETSPDLKPYFEKLDSLLEDDELGKETEALELIRSLKESKQVVGFEGARQVPKRTYTLADLRLHKIDASKLLAPVDTTLSRLRSTAQLAFIGVITVGVLTDVLKIPAALIVVTSTLVLIGVDQAKTAGGGEFLLLEALASVLQPAYARRVAIHEAGHFLIAYFVGLLPKNYTLSAYGYYKKYGKFNIQAGTTFCDSEFQEEVKSGQLKAKSLDRLTCVAVAGVVAEYLTYGHSEGGINDILQLDRLMRSLRFSQRKVDAELRMLHWELADAMSEDKSVGECLDLVEKNVRNSKDF